MLFGAGKFGLAKIIFRQQVRSIASRQTILDKMTIVNLQISEGDAGHSVFLPGSRYCTSYTARFLSW